MSQDKKTIIVEKTSESEDHDAFIADLPETECRFAVKDFLYESDPAEGARNKILFITWTPDNAPIRSKMVFAASKDALRRSLNGIQAEVQGTEHSEVSYETILEKVTKRKSTN
ncbi:hypothetical protein N7522_002787 [Penicillium canescens]|uniref:Cofilin n=1 Tax=Penicillium canescens TaxID=5083 RepID=A0AAD6NDC7_PENCN|nr:uncharacterized protein N7446_007153 [Penicillium canescens]KAJ6012432.1 hypothetical protein N7522_002787 [Penicillium canescens]KAJ6049518.1 hypothetical protein N7444_006234 [Penicillium canescens]KAJ6052513.1 hypothetical protein N7460_003047 [Penicillium canescens]KAJ6063033.1 hypothetical protein N7446_007153 [Penicillium canescens]